MISFKERLSKAVTLLNLSKNVAAFTGAGISTDSGISDFRSKGGVWDRYRIVTYQEFISSHKARVEYWNMKKELYGEIKDAKPNRAHLALAELEKISNLKCLITQNIDGLHQASGSSNVIELHGTNRKAVCLDCGKKWPIEEVQTWLEQGEIDPSCDVCQGYVKPATISFGQSMPESEMIRAFKCAASCDLLLMIGSSLQVEPAASIPREAFSNGAKLIYINRTQTPTDNLADVCFRENASQVFDELLKLLKSGMNTT
ncbi:MAG: Sir2 family NAD-dependent protein deacetylase [Nitrospiraceae bacterium]|nr:MAG: Sir2 family NAD-dependent protein deacetylase [Nitrospiraceae bacterium]